MTKCTGTSADCRFFHLQYHIVVNNPFMDVFPHFCWLRKLKILSVSRCNRKTFLCKKKILFFFLAFMFYNTFSKNCTRWIPGIMYVNWKISNQNTNSRTFWPIVSFYLYLCIPVINCSCNMKNVLINFLMNNITL